MNNEGIKILDYFKNRMVLNINDNAKAIIKKSDFDKTYIGFVSEKVECSDGSYRWRIQTNGVAYDIKPEMCNITEVGQKVRLFVPNHKYHDKYAEVITNYIYEHPSKIVYDNTNDTVTETWLLNDNTEQTVVFKLHIENKDTENEEVTAIEFPDGNKMILEGFNIG